MKILAALKETMVSTTVNFEVYNKTNYPKLDSLLANPLTIACANNSCLQTCLPVGRKFASVQKGLK